MSNTKKTPELARYATVETTALIETYCDWIETQTGRRPDAWSVYVGAQLRGPFQKSDGNQKRLAAEAKAREAEAVAKAARQIEREKAAQEKATEKAAALKADPKPKAKAVRSAAAKLATSKTTPAKTTTRRRPARVAPAVTNEAASA